MAFLITVAYNGNVTWFYSTWPSALVGPGHFSHLHIVRKAASGPPPQHAQCRGQPKNIPAQPRLHYLHTGLPGSVTERGQAALGTDTQASCTDGHLTACCPPCAWGKGEFLSWRPTRLRNKAILRNHPLASPPLRNLGELIPIKMAVGAAFQSMTDSW